MVDKANIHSSTLCKRLPSYMLSREPKHRYIDNALHSTRLYTRVRLKQLNAYMTSSYIAHQLQY
jgi:hypothetical protein